MRFAFANAPVGIVSNSALICNVFLYKEPQYEKAFFPILWILAGIIRSPLTLWQAWNALGPISFIPEPNVNVPSKLECWNAHSPINVVVFGIIIFPRKL